MNKPMAVAAALLVLAFAGLTWAGEDPAIGSTSIPAGAGSACITVSPNTVHSFQCFSGTLTYPSAVVRYRYLSAGEHAAGYPVPTDGGAIGDGGIYGPQVNFVLNPDPYRSPSRSNQVKLCFMTLDGGAGLATKCEVSVSSP